MCLSFRLLEQQYCSGRYFRENFLLKNVTLSKSLDPPFLPIPSSFHYLLAHPADSDDAACPFPPSLPLLYELGIYRKRRNRCEMSATVIAKGLSQSNAVSGAFCPMLGRFGNFWICYPFWGLKSGKSLGYFLSLIKYCRVVICDASRAMNDAVIQSYSNFNIPPLN